MGNQESKIPNNEGILSSTGEAVIFIFFEVNFSTKLGSFGAYVLNLVPFDNVPFIPLPVIYTSTTLPLSTSVKKAENGIVFNFAP